MMIAASALLLACANPATAQAWQAEVERRIDNEMNTPPASSQDVRMAEIAMRFDAEGRFIGAELARTSGLSQVDAEAARVARTISYPQLPPHMRGKERTVLMRILFGNDPGRLAVRTKHIKTDAQARAAAVDRTPSVAVVAAQPKG